MTQTLSSSTTTPLTPPKLEEDRLSWLRLYRSKGVGTRGFFKLLHRHGSARAALDRLPELAADAGTRDYSAADPAAIAREAEAARRIGARLLCMGDSDWPARLDDIADAPPILWALGRTDLLAAPSVALIGARNASSLGARMARGLAEGLGAAGQVVVSGLARGIDAEAHSAALPTGTVAVVAGGLDIPYPSENAALHAQIGREGCIVSEQPLGLQPQARHFPRRNRLISGLSRALVVVEAAARSGSLGTARTALDQGREVMAVPGHPFDPRAAGSNLLIRDGAALVRNAADILAGLATLPLGLPFAAPPPSLRCDAGPALRETSVDWRSEEPGAPEHAATPLVEAVLDRLGPVPVPEDQLIRDLGCPPAALAATLLDLELDGRLQRHAGGLIARA